MREKDLYITTVNLNVREPDLADIARRGATVKKASMILLRNSDIHAHNTFEQREVVVPQTRPLSLSNGTLVVELPPASVAALNIKLG